MKVFASTISHDWYRNNWVRQLIGHGGASQASLWMNWENLLKSWITDVPSRKMPLHRGNSPPPNSQEAAGVVSRVPSLLARWFLHCTAIFHSQFHVSWTWRNMEKHGFWRKIGKPPPQWKHLLLPGSLAQASVWTYLKTVWVDKPQEWKWTFCWSELLPHSVNQSASRSHLPFCAVQHVPCPLSLVSLIHACLLSFLVFRCFWDILCALSILLDGALVVVCPRHEPSRKPSCRIMFEVKCFVISQSVHRAR